MPTTTMQQASDSIGSLAGALARAQVELVNPEKSMVASIRPEGRGAAEQIFRYAPLSDGLNIIRKALGQHEIATMQSTSVDRAAGLIRLNTVLAHSSGEWISSDWPVCPLEDLASPKRMGAALTYARRYALFALVGIAGEDDLDAPDLNIAEPVDARGTATAFRTRPNGRDGHPSRRPSTNSRPEPSPAPADSGLRRKLSAVLRDQLLAIWKISIRQKVLPFGRAAFFRLKTACTKQMRGKWRRLFRQSLQWSMANQTSSAKSIVTTCRL
jgi:hypothetical protein